jgi:hypothetical protein
MVPIRSIRHLTSAGGKSRGRAKGSARVAGSGVKAAAGMGSEDLCVVRLGGDALAAV